jgi:hypothetical protein
MRKVAVWSGLKLFTKNLELVGWNAAFLYTFERHKYLW